MSRVTAYEIWPSAETDSRGRSTLWSPCADCGSVRRVTLRKGVPVSTRCHSCAAKKHYVDHPFILPASRVCKVCGVEKETQEFMKDHGRYAHRCKQCRAATRTDYAKSSMRNRVLFGTSHTPLQLAVAGLHRKRVSTKMQSLYGSCLPPDELQKVAARIRKRNREVRSEAVVLYGSKCVCCGETDIWLLTFDHINGGGSKDKKSRTYLSYYTAVIAAGYPNSVYRLLCWNCNSSFGRYGYCPHSGGSQDKPKSYSAAYNRRLRAALIRGYGGKCSLCGESHPEFMTIDHINGGGRKHQAELRKQGGVNLYRVLRDLGWPKDEYRLLCYNCNCSPTNRWRVS